MHALPLARRLATIPAIACLGAGVSAAVAAPQGGSARSPAKITPAGVGGVKLGAEFTALHAKHLVGKLKAGCQLAGPQARSARLSAPLKGGVDFTMTAPRKVTDISLTGGALARGVGIGASIATIKAAFPKAKVDHSTDQTFAITLVKIPKGGGGKLQFGVDTKTKKVTLIGIPFIPFCD